MVDSPGTKPGDLIGDLRRGPGTHPPALCRGFAAVDAPPGAPPFRFESRLAPFPEIADIVYHVPPKGRKIHGPLVRRGAVHRAVSFKYYVREGFPFLFFIDGFENSRENRLAVPAHSSVERTAVHDGIVHDRKPDTASHEQSAGTALYDRYHPCVEAEEGVPARKGAVVRIAKADPHNVVFPFSEERAYGFLPVLFPAEIQNIRSEALGPAGLGYVLEPDGSDRRINAIRVDEGGVHRNLAFTGIG